jgi:hypothetical protein
MALAEPPSNPLASVTCRLQLAGFSEIGGFRSWSFSVFSSLFFPARIGSARRISSALLRHFYGQYTGAQAGQTACYWLRWVNTRGEKARGASRSAPPLRDENQLQNTRD